MFFSVLLHCHKVSTICSIGLESNATYNFPEFLPKPYLMPDKGYNKAMIYA